MADKKCPTCGSQLYIKQTKRKPSQLTQPFYYTAYYFCSHCGKIYHDNEFKVINENLELFTGNTVLGDPVDIEIWTDGACIFNGRENARAAWAFVSGEYEKAGKVDGKQTNNRAEAQAILEALKWAGEKGKKRVRLYSDSLITLQNLRKPLEKINLNKDIFEKIYHIIDTYGLDIQYEKVLGHSGVENNERADKLANTLATSA